ncbi:hypothetical protein QJS66_13000 [Kocuria rhizophila]|nr:hypothetical protein QJS66_13000 [Kocuria rhizophila]
MLLADGTVLAGTAPDAVEPGGGGLPRGSKRWAAFPARRGDRGVRVPAPG